MFSYASQWFAHKPQRAEAACDDSIVDRIREGHNLRKLFDSPAHASDLEAFKDGAVMVRKEGIAARRLSQSIPCGFSGILSTFGCQTDASAWSHHEGPNQNLRCRH